MTMLNPSLSRIIEEMRLPISYAHTLETYLIPLAHNIANTHNGTPMLLGMQGSQGSGKSTLSKFLCVLLSQEHGLNCVALSLDDFYLTRAQRETLAKTVHPLLLTRGVPGTHDTQLATDTIQSLLNWNETNSPIAIPRFNKAIDDRYPASDWNHQHSKTDIVIFEGWCTGVAPQANIELEQAINDLEAKEDASGEWRRYVNTKLADEYQSLFNLIDRLVVLQAPSFECVYDWRWLQEQKLIEKLKDASEDQKARVLDEAGVRHFISHYERLTRHCLLCLPDQCNWQLNLNKEHEIIDLITHSSAIKNGTS